MAKVKVTLVKSTIGSTQTQKATVAALGLKKIRSFRIHKTFFCSLICKIHILTGIRSIKCCIISGCT